MNLSTKQCIHHALLSIAIFDPGRKIPTRIIIDRYVLIFYSSLISFLYYNQRLDKLESNIIIKLDLKSPNISFEIF